MVKKNVFLLCLLLVCGLGFHFILINNGVVKKIDGVLMVSGKEMSDVLGLTFMVEDDNITFRQDDIILKINCSSPYVRKDGCIMYILEKPPVDIGGKAYIPSSFFSDYLQISLNTNNRNQLSIMNTDDFSLYDVVKFSPAEILAALDDINTPYQDKILHAVVLPRSMNITIPKINMEKVIVNTPLDSYGYDIKQELLNHGYSEADITSFCYEDFKAIEASWKLDNEMIHLIEVSYPELKNNDLSNWTYGDYNYYFTNKDKINLGTELSEEQKKQFIHKGILLEDIFYLHKEFYDLDTILAQPDSVLKDTIEGYYQLSIDWLRAKNERVMGTFLSPP